MAAYALSSILDSICCFATASLLLIRSRKQGWILALLLYAVGLWMAYPWAVATFPDVNPLLLVRSFYVVGVCIPSLVLLFALTTLQRRLSQFSFYLSLTLSVAFGVLLFSPSFFSDVQQSPTNVLPVPGVGFAAFAFYFVCVGLYSLAAIIYTYQTIEVWKTSRMKWIAMAFASAGAGIAIHVAAVTMGKEPLPHDFFMIAFALTLGYAVLRRRLYEIELLTREAASTIVTAVLAALPLLIGRVFAPIVANLPSIARFEAVCTLLATLSFFAVAVTLVRYSERSATRHLSRIFLFASLLNGVYFMWAVPRHPLSIPVLRLTYLLTGCTILSWVEYRRAYFEESSSGGFSLYKLWRWGSYGWLVLAATTPFVMQSLEYYQTTRRPFAVIPGPAHLFFHLWWALSYAAAALWTAQRFWKLFGRSHKIAAISLMASLVAGGLTLAFSASFGLGYMKWPWHISLELLTAAGLLATSLWQPHSGRHPTSAMLTTIFMATMVSSLSGFLLFQGLWMQLLASLLLAFSMPKIVGQFRDSAQALVDHYLFRKKFSYLSELQQMGDDIFRFTNLPGLLRRLAEDLAERSKLEWAGVWLFDLSEGRFLLRQAAGSQHTHLDPSAVFKLSFKTNDALLQCFRAEHGLLIADELLAVSGEHKLEQESVESRAFEQLKQAKLAAVFPLYLGIKVIGFLGLGPKEDQSVFHQGDRASLNSLGQKAERAVGQAYMLYEQSLMFSKLAHDTLNFLQAMGMNMDILQNEYLGPLNERQKKQLSIAAHQRELIRESLVDLRELERLMVLRMQGTWQMVPFGLKEIVDEAILVFAPRAASQNITFSTDAGPMLQALGEPRAIRRVMDNLLVNALKFAPTGGRVDLRLYQKADNLIVEVTDTGPGIPQNELSRIFDPFYQTSNNSVIPRGTGLGLSVVKEIIALHRGRIEVKSTLGTGTTFTIELPSVLRLKEFQPAPDPALAPAPGNPLERRSGR